MGGSSGGSTFYGRSPSDLRKQIREAELEAAEKNFSPKLAERLNSLLAQVNDRDEAKTTQRLEEVKGALGDEIEAAFDLRFGGSVAKHTYVDGLSDVDTLIIMRHEDPERPHPTTVLNDIAASLSEKLESDITVSRGSMAVTLTYPDGDEIQLVPAIRENDRLHVPEWNANTWSRIDPNKFRRGLTKRNSECGMKLVPTVKLAKVINAGIPESLRLSGYHIESLAISAFKGYAGPYTIDKMLPHFFRSMSTLVRTPIRDSTGQSVHVDEYLGRANSDTRLQVSHVLDRISRRMQNATAAESMEQWNAMLGEPGR
jgi:hypothetical protein